MNKTFHKHDIVGASSAVLCLVALYMCPDIVKRSTAEALAVCGRSVIPSLFPFITATRLCLHFSSGLIGKLKGGKKIGTMTFSGCIALILGLLSGFPTGAILAGQMYEKGILTKAEAEKAAVFSSAASPAFCIIFLGVEILKSRLSGLFIYISAIICNIILFLLHELFFSAEETKAERSCRNVQHKTDNVSQIIYESCMTVIGICAYVTFFMCIGDVVSSITAFFIGHSGKTAILLSGIFELTSASASLCGAEYSERYMLGSVFVGFGGISAILQVMSVCEKHGLSCRYLLPAKLISALVVPIISFLVIVLSAHFGDILSATDIVPFLGLITALFAFLVYFLKKTVKKYKKSKVNL